MPEKKISDIQFLLVEFMMEARRKGIKRLHRKEVLFGDSKLPNEFRAKLVFTALTMPTELVCWIDHDQFELTDMMVKIYDQTIGKKLGHNQIRIEPVEPIFCLPDLSNRRLM